MTYMIDIHKPLLSPQTTCCAGLALYHSQFVPNNIMYTIFITNAIYIH